MSWMQQIHSLRAKLVDTLPFHVIRLGKHGMFWGVAHWIGIAAGAAAVGIGMVLERG